MITKKHPPMFPAVLFLLGAGCGSGQSVLGDAASSDGSDNDAAAEQLTEEIGQDTSPEAPRDMPVDNEELLCTIDLIFAVDNSGSMQEEIRDFRLNVWPRFAEALLEVSGGTGGEIFRVGVLDACPDPANFHVRGKSGACDFASGEVWMESDSPRLVEEFQCVGDIWDEDSNCTGNNDDEQPASAAATALEPPWSDPGGRNYGFLRDDALLIVIAITDEDEQPVPAASEDIVYQRLIAAKDDDPRKMVFLGIGGERDCTGPYGEADEAVMLKSITERFAEHDRGVFWDLCEGSLEDGLTEAMSVIDEACRELPMI